MNLELAVRPFLFTYAMTSDVPRPKPDGNRAHPGRFHESVITPTQAIAEAWQRECPKNQDIWRQAEAKRREQYSAPRPPRRPGSKM